MGKQDSYTTLIGVHEIQNVSVYEDLLLNIILYDITTKIVGEGKYIVY